MIRGTHAALLSALIALAGCATGVDAPHQAALPVEQQVTQARPPVETAKPDAPKAPAEPAWRAEHDARIEAIHADLQAWRERPQKYVDAHPDLPADYKRLILARSIGIGMRAEQVVAALGEPESVDVTESAGGRSEFWVYTDEVGRHTYVTFGGDRVRGWRFSK